MGLLSAAQILAIAAGARFRQVFKIDVPQAAGSSSWNLNTIHDDADGTPGIVKDAGRRDVEAFNVSFADPGRLSVARYDIVVSNGDGKFVPAAFQGHWENSSTSYDADPTECRLEHEVYVWVAGAWSEITGINYVGKVTDVNYMDIADVSGMASAVCEISTEQIGIEEYFRRVWSVDDGDDHDTTANIKLDLT